MRTTRLGIAAVAGLMLLASCATADPSTKAIDELRRNAESFRYEIGTYGGTLTFATISEPLTLNPELANDAGSSSVLGYLFEGLTDISWLTDEVEPSLARGWETSEDGLRWVFYLRDDVRWHDGEPFTARDVDFTFNEVIYSDDFHASGRSTFEFRSYNSQTGEWESEPMQVSALDDYTVEIVLPKPEAPFLRSMTAWIYPKHLWEESISAGTFTEFWGIDTDPREIVGTGPFTIDEYEPGQRVVMKRNPNYWKTDAAGSPLPYLEQVIHRVVPDLAGELELFLSGTSDYHGVLGTEYAELAPRQEELNFTLYERGPGFGSSFLSFNQNPGSGDDGEPYVDPNKRYWFENVDFRRAVAHTLDKDTMIADVQQGQAYPQYSSISPATGDFHNHGVRRYAFDMAAANELLDGLGWLDTDGDGIREDDRGVPIAFTLVTNDGNTVREEITRIIHRGMRAVGLDVTFELVPFGDLVESLTATFDWESMVIGFTGGSDPFGGIALWHSSETLHLWNPNQSEPATEWEAEIDRIYVDAVAELDTHRRVALYREAQEIVAENVPLIYTTLGERLSAVRNVFGNLTPTLYGHFDVRYLYRTDQ